MNSYKALNKQTYTKGEFTLVPIRFEDRWDIMKWRNEQIYHLRQPKLLTAEDQNYYFNNVVSRLFDQEQPTQILFSFLKEDICVGYGGLVHINWVDKNAEISFIINTEFEKNHFEEYWSIYLKLIEEVAFKILDLHKLFVYAFDLRSHLYKMLETNQYFLDARLKEHCSYNERYIDVLIYSKIV